MKIIFLCTSPHETYYQIETLSHNKSDFGVYKKKQYQVNFFRVFNIKKWAKKTKKYFFLLDWLRNTD